MVESQQVRLKKKKKSSRDDESASPDAAAEKKKKLKQLDDFIEGVLREAGEEFLEEFKQVEGE
ncbi:MAG: hypothetical protein P4L55_06115 [Syntrophobacteraceae bacterium]|nr:hypothetical protein [Syntrophobacteraceae bacterium]